MTEMDDCAQIREQLYSLAVGECDNGAARAIREHIVKCPQCAAEFSRMREVVRLTGLLEDTEPSRDLYAAVASRIRPPYFWAKVAAAAAVAAVFVVLLLYAIVGPVQRVEKKPTGIQAREQVQPEKTRVVDVTPDVRQEPASRRELPVQVPQKESHVARGPGNQLQESPELPEEKGESQAVKTPEPRQAPPEQPEPEPQKPTMLAKVGSLAGEVKVKRLGTDEWLEADTLLSILPGDTLTTNSLGRARMDFDPGVHLYLNNNAKVAVSVEGDEIVFRLEKGEIYVEKDTDQGTVAVDTGFGTVRLQKGHFNLKMSGGNKCLIHVFDGEVECRDTDKGYHGKYQESTRAWFQRGRRCQKGTKLRSKEAIRWTVKLRPDDQEKKQARQDKPGEPGKQDDPGVPPGAGPRPGRHDPPGDGKPPKDPPGDGKVGPGPAPAEPRPGGGGRHGPGDGHKPGGNQGGCPNGGGK